VSWARCAVAAVLLGLGFPAVSQAADPVGCPGRPDYVGYGELLHGLPAKRIQGTVTVSGSRLHITHPFGRIVFAGQRIRVLYRFEHSPHPKLAATLKLARVEQGGRAGKLVAHGHSHLLHGSLAVGLKVPGRAPSRYRLTLTLLHGGEAVKSLSEYLVAVKPLLDARLVLGAATYRQSDTVNGRLENFGSVSVTYGADYAFERLESGNWVAVGPPGIFPAIGFGLPAGEASPCLTFRLPAGSLLGHYRVRKRLIGGEATAEFDLVSG